MPIMIGKYTKPEFEYLADNEWVFTEKVDGTNIRVMYDGEKIRFGGKTDNAQIPVRLLDRLNEIFSGKEDVFNEIFTGKEICLYGEGYGSKIQKAGSSYIADNVDYVLFDIKVNHTWLARSDVEGIGEKLGIKVVPIIGRGTINDALELVRGGFKSTWGDFIAEGLVIRPKEELLDRGGNRIITKIKYQDYINLDK